MYGVTKTQADYLRNADSMPVSASIHIQTRAWNAGRAWSLRSISNTAINSINLEGKTKQKTATLFHEAEFQTARAATPKNNNSECELKQYFRKMKRIKNIIKNAKLYLSFVNTGNLNYGHEQNEQT